VALFLSRTGNRKAHKSFEAEVAVFNLGVLKLERLRAMQILKACRSYGTLLETDDSSKPDLPRYRVRAKVFPNVISLKLSIQIQRTRSPEIIMDQPIYISFSCPKSHFTGHRSNNPTKFLPTEGPRYKIDL
jgi:hypothetical protein